MGCTRWGASSISRDSLARSGRTSHSRANATHMNLLGRQHDRHNRVRKFTMSLKIKHIVNFGKDQKGNGCDGKQKWENQADVMVGFLAWDHSVRQQ